MSFAHTNRTYKYDIAFFLNKLQVEQVFNLNPVDFFGPGPVKMIHGFYDRELRASSKINLHF
jgi:hypothetical protein